MVGARGGAAVVGARGGAVVSDPAAVGERTRGNYWRYGRGRCWGWGGGFYNYGWPYYSDYGWPYDYDYYPYDDYYSSQPASAATIIFVRGNSLVANVQRELRRDGYYRGGIDGAIGPESRAAIRAYQVDHGLPVTGRIDYSLLRSLRLS